MVMPPFPLSVYILIGLLWYLSAISVSVSLMTNCFESLSYVPVCHPHLFDEVFLQILGPFLTKVVCFLIKL